MLEELTEPYRTMILVAACLGLRASEVIGLQWGDFNWEGLTLLVRRSVVRGRVADTKTEASRFPLPVDPRLAGILKQQWHRTLYRAPSDWVFAIRAGKPRCQESILQRQIKPAALRAGLDRIGWHTFRHSYSTLLRRVRADIKVQQELLRHSTIQSTMNVYTQAMSEGKRTANSEIVRSLLPFETCRGELPHERANGSQWVPRSLQVVAGGGFEPPTFGL